MSPISPCSQPPSVNQVTPLRCSSHSHPHRRRRSSRRPQVNATTAHQLHTKSSQSPCPRPSFNLVPHQGKATSTQQRLFPSPLSNTLLCFNVLKLSLPPLTLLRLPLTLSPALAVQHHHLHPTLSSLPSFWKHTTNPSFRQAPPTVSLAQSLRPQDAQHPHTRTASSSTRGAEEA